MKKIRRGCVIPSGAMTVTKKQIVYRERIEKKPEVGDLVYGSVNYMGQHSTLENKQGRIHTIYDGFRAVFVYGNRYAPDAFEGFVPEDLDTKADLLSRSGIVGRMNRKNTNVLGCTKIKVLGYVCDRQGNVINTRKYRLLPFAETPGPSHSPAKMIAVVGTAMNTGKSRAAATCCWALSTMGYKVNACKVTGTASLKDILLMQDCGAANVADFSYLGQPSTYMLDEDELLKILWSLDRRYGSSKGYWVVELADGILQRETAVLLKSEHVRNRVHKLVFCAHDALGAIGGVNILRETYGLVPDAISGLCSSSPLAIEELRCHVDIPHFDSAGRDLELMASILL